MKEGKFAQEARVPRRVEWMERASKRYRNSQHSSGKAAADKVGDWHVMKEADHRARALPIVGTRDDAISILASPPGE
jgi:hypothetical protein